MKTNERSRTFQTWSPKAQDLVAVFSKASGHPKENFPSMEVKNNRVPFKNEEACKKGREGPRPRKTTKL